MAERKPFLLRLDPATHRALEGWSADELRRLNSPIENLLRRALQVAGRLPAEPRTTRLRHPRRLPPGPRSHKQISAAQNPQPLKLKCAAASPAMP
jgi:hypothetical protein